MKRNFILYLLVSMLLMITHVNGQSTENEATAKSQQRIEKDLDDANKHQNKIDKSQKKIKKQQKKIDRQERKREKKMKKIKKEQKKISN
jgi:hypothetical protein